jgi:hypothetical protein
MIQEDVDGLFRKSSIALLLLLYPLLESKFITRDPNRPLARIRDGPFRCGSEHLLVN